MVDPSRILMDSERFLGFWMVSAGSHEDSYGFERFLEDPMNIFLRDSLRILW